jgi:hypothetical protein
MSTNMARLEKIIDMIGDPNRPSGLMVFGSMADMMNLGPHSSVAGDTSFGVAEEDLSLWNAYIKHRFDVNIQAILKAKKYHLLTQVIGNPNDPRNRVLRHNETRYGNTMLHDRLVMTCDESVVTVKAPNALPASLKEHVNVPKKATDFLLRAYELWVKSPKQHLKDLVKKGILALDVEGKTPLLLACKTLNEHYALRILNLDVDKVTLEITDNIELRTPLHYACILGLSEIAKSLIKAGANKMAVDKYGCTPGYYLTCSDDEIKIHIDQSLESVNFFYGIFFETERKNEVINTLFNNNRALAKELEAQLSAAAVNTTAAAAAAATAAGASAAPVPAAAPAAGPMPTGAQPSASASSSEATAKAVDKTEAGTAILFKYSDTNQASVPTAESLSVEALLDSAKTTVLSDGLPVEAAKPLSAIQGNIKSPAKK